MADDDGAALLEKLGSVITDVAQALHDDALAGEPGREADRLHVLDHVTGLAHAEENAAAGGFGPAAYAAELHRLPGHATEGIQVVRTDLGIGIGDPGHFLGTGAEIGGWNIDPRPDVVLPHELEGVAPGDALEFSLGELVTRNPDATLGAAERHVHHGALVGHEGRERHGLFRVDVDVVADTALGRQLVLAVFRPPGVDRFQRAIIAPERKAELDHGIALPDLAQERRMMARQRRRTVKTGLDLREKAGTLGHDGSGLWINRLTELGKVL